MKLRASYILILFYSLCSGHVYSQQDKASDKNILPAAALKPYGRYFIDQQKNLGLITSGVHFGFSFTGKECILYAFINETSGHNYLQYELDGVYQKRIKIMGGAVQPVAFNTTTDGPHTIWIYKATEAHTGPILIQKITGNNLHVIKPSNAPLIEFIGNSITCGAAADTSEVKCGAGVYHDQHNAYYAYGPRVAKALNANFILSSVSGIGIYRTWNNDGPGMPEVYEKESFHLEDAAVWNFKMYQPKVVSIAIGTNDMSHGDGIHPRPVFDSAVFIKRYVSFIQLVKSKYPQARIALLSSPMMNGRDRTILQDCLIEVKRNVDALYPENKPVMLFFFSPMSAGGCSGHPSVRDHAVLAQALVPFFRNLLK